MPVDDTTFPDPPPRLRRRALAIRLIGFIGALVFAIVLALASLSPLQVEQAARGFIEHQVEREVAEKIGGVRARLDETRLGRFAEALSARHAAQIAVLRAQLAQDLKPRVKATVAHMQDSRCTCRLRMKQALVMSEALHIAALDRAAPQLQRMIEGQYGAIVADLLGEVRIFAATNLLAFLALLALSALRPQYIAQLFVPAILLCAATIVSSLFYLFGQNWFFTILYADYTGYAYAAWLLLVFGFLSDIALFKARVTRGIGHVLSSAVAVLPC